VKRMLDARRVAAGAALIAVIGAIGVWAEGPAVLGRVYPVQGAAIGDVAPARVAAAELDFGAPAAPSAALPVLLLPSDRPSFTAVRARWLASHAALRLPDASAAWSRQPEP
jgi:hypothetical protein